MRISNKFFRFVDSAIRERGGEYFRQGRVWIKRGDRESVDAKVRGAREYRVRLVVTDGGLWVNCGCPYFEDNLESCKHIWATMLKASTLGYLSDADSAPERIIYDDSYNYDDDEDHHYSSPPARPRPSAASSSVKASSQAWKQQLSQLSKALNESPPVAAAESTDKQVLYLIDIDLTLSGQSLVVETALRSLKKNGEWGIPKARGFDLKGATDLMAEDLTILSLMKGADTDSYSSGYYYSSYYARTPTRYKLRHPLEQTLVPMMCATGRCWIRRNSYDNAPSVLEWDDGPTWEFRLEARTGESSRQLVITGALHRGDERMELSAPVLMVTGGLVFFHDRAARLDDRGAFAWIGYLRRHGALYAPMDQADDVLEELLQMPRLPAIELPQELRFEEIRFTPSPRLKVKKGESRFYYRGQETLWGELSFDYDGRIVLRSDPRRGIFDRDTRRVILRDEETEKRMADRLLRAGFRQNSYYSIGPVLELAPAKLPKAARDLVTEGWTVEAEGKLYRQPGEFRMEVTSGIDWFDLDGTVDFGGVSASLPALLAALRRGENTVQLGDGTFGLLPEEWLKKYGMLAGLGEVEGDSLRFKRSQTGLLDALLASQPQVSFDESFARARRELQSFDGIRAQEATAGFAGELRHYQKEGLGWIHFLQRFGFGGCLADDMGLGKCVGADTLIAVNGILLKAEDIWNRHAGQTTFDGEGDWAEPAETLLTNSIEQTGRIVQARIKRLYRQRVREHVRRVILVDGSSVMITQRHKLLTDKGWTNELHENDRVGVHAQEVYYCKIKSIEEVFYDGWVYDFEVEDHHNFVGNGILCHNTVQVLALLEARRGLRASQKSKRKNNGAPVAPSLVVVPRSLVFNWIEEAARFTPRLRALDHTGMKRVKGCDHFKDYDLIITTYGTLRRDALDFKDYLFDYVILDEAQAIKNSASESAKAARLLRGNYKLALSGTPIENHLGELWSLFEFLNPGLLGAASVFQLGNSRNPDEDTRRLLARGLRPFILRRTKEQVAKELPAKIEQTIYCDMEKSQRKLYDELRDHYRRSLLGLVDKNGMGRAKIQILEALLRLRQAACHPGLLDKKKVSESSAKLDVLVPQIEEVIDEGHKALVFSQFTSFLSILRSRLDDEKIVYEYLDGRTRDRQSKVARFQNDEECRLFLVSLKAGGLGLNLTAAEYVFLLDPWWNPAVESQAIDRAHRIGQTRQVFAYRLIARDTVEEKVLELQKTKRELADAIINADNSLMRSLAREDLELLLS
jgi:hypothetical protein